MATENYNSYPNALSVLAQKLKRRTFAPDEYYIVLTPDRYTQTVEHALFGGCGALDCEVLTLSRLARRISPDDKILSREGGVMITAQAISSVKDELVYCSRAARFNDFAREAYETLMQISASDTDIKSIPASGSAASKLHDLAIIKDKYDELKAQYLDASDRLTELIKNIPNSSLIARSHIIAVGYANITRLNSRVFAVLKKYAASFEYVKAEQQLPRRKGISLFSAPDRVSQYKEIATAIRDYVYNGGKYGDVSIICPSPRTLSRILREYNIRFYTDEAVSLADTPPLVALSYIYKLKCSADADTLVALAKNPFSGCDAQDAELLQSYVVSHGITYGVFDKTYTDPAAARAVERAKYLTDVFDGSFADAVEAVMDKCGFDEIRKRLYDGETDTIAPILSLTALLRRYGAADFDTAAVSFFSAARAVNVKSLPRERDCVTVTMPQTLRMTACKLLFVTDFNEGVLPTVTADSGLINDAELKSMGGVVEPSVREQNRRERAELFAVVANAESVVCTYSTAGGGRPAAFIGELAEHIDEYDYSERRSALLDSDDPEYIATYACTAGAARELAALGMTKHSLSVAAAAGKSDMSAQAFVPKIDCEVKPTLSVSELSHWFKCPYKRFLSDAVGLKERRTAALGAPDFGIVVHDFMRRLLQSETVDCSRGNVERILKSVLDDNGLFADETAFSRLADDATDYAEANIEVIRAGEYNPELFEYPFGGKLYFGKAKTKFVGVIDRVDVCGDRARVVDYKTFDKKFSVKACLDGTDMQLPLYAAAVRESGKDVTGMFYLPLSSRYGERSKPMSGYVVKDMGVVEEYDAKLADGGMRSEIMSVALKVDKASGELDFSGNSGAVMDGDVFDALIDKCIKTADVAADEIASGYIERTPTDGACVTCAFLGICGNVKTARGDDKANGAKGGEE